MDDDLWDEEFFRNEPMETENDVPQECEVSEPASVLKKPVGNEKRSGIRPLAIVDPLNWFVNIETKEDDKKRRKLEDEQAVYETNVRKIEQLKAKRFAASSNVQQARVRKEINSHFLLDLPPHNTCNWMGISAVVDIGRKYITYDPIEYNEKESKKFKAMSKEVADIVTKADAEYTVIKDYVPERPVVNHKTEGKQLWIERYAPSTFLDLLTEDKVNRMALCWLNLWNEYIFNTPSVHSKLTEYEQGLLEIEGKNPSMPKKKIMMIHGPVGCGKTSLAVMVAKVQYEPFLINMSEVTTVEELKRVLLLASSYHAVNFTKRARKPRCLIVDGLEYATTDIVSALLKWTAEKKQKNARRPIICTCNNLYVPALRELRSNAFCLKATVDIPRLFQKVQDICYRERVSASKLTLKNFVDGANSDIRLCINTLQFQCDSIYSDTTARDLDVNHKSELSIFEALETILTLNKHKNGIGNLMSPKERLERVSNVIYARSDLEKFTELVFHNIPPVCKAIRMIAKSSIDMIEGDIVQTMVNARHDYSLMKYSTNSLVKTHFHVAKATHRRLNLTIAVRWKECQNEAQSRYSAHLQDAVASTTAGNNIRKCLRPSTFLDKTDLMNDKQNVYQYRHGSNNAYTRPGFPKKD